MRVPAGTAEGELRDRGSNASISSAHCALIPQIGQPFSVFSLAEVFLCKGGGLV